MKYCIPNLSFLFIAMIIQSACSSNKSIITPLPGKHQLQLRLEPHISGEESGQKYFSCTGQVITNGVSPMRIYYTSFVGNCQINQDQKLNANLRQSEVALPGSLGKFIKDPSVVVLEYLQKNKTRYDTLKKYGMLDPVYLPHEN
jgi:hypothetical protein